ncbi:MAG: hypothetical protein QM767_12135 [Anaeromyxobacter sp.]
MTTAESAPSAVPQQPLALVSPVATFWISLAGGPLAALWVGGVNLARAGRLRRDAAALVVVGLLALVAYGALFAALGWPLLFPDPDRAYWFAARVWYPLGAAAYGVLWLRLRGPWADQAADPEPWADPWNQGILVVIAAWVLRLLPSLNPDRPALIRPDPRDGLRRSAPIAAIHALPLVPEPPTR